MSHFSGLVVLTVFIYCNGEKREFIFLNHCRNIGCQLTVLKRQKIKSHLVVGITDEQMHIIEIFHIVFVMISNILLIQEISLLNVVINTFMCKNSMILLKFAGRLMLVT